MAPASTRQPVSRPLVPVVPRIFETRAKASPPAKAVSEPVDVTPASEVSRAPVEEAVPAAEPSDWASLVGADDDQEEARSVIGDGEAQAVVQTPKASGAVNGISNGGPPPEPTGTVWNDREQHESAPLDNGFAPVMPSRVPNSSGYPPGLSTRAPRRAGQHIAFGSFDHKVVSEASSPIFPPSATSTRSTQPTPMSDSHSQSSSRGGHVNNTVEPALHPHSSVSNGVRKPNYLEQRPAVMDFAAHAAATFAERNRDDLVKAVGQDLYAQGPAELDVVIETQDGKEEFKISRAICRRASELSHHLDRSVTRGSHSGDPITKLQLRTMSAFVNRESVRAVLQSLYGLPMAPPKRPLDIVATGYLVGARMAVDFGTELALKTSSHWEALATNFHFCLEDSKFEYGDGKTPNLVDLSTIIGVYKPHYVELLAQSLDCIIREINSDEGFRFDDHAACFTQLGGGFHARPVSVELHTHVAQSRPTHGHSQSQIQFGNLEKIFHLKYQVLSSLLLSLPLIVLQHILSHVINLSIVQDVIQEREKRRVHAVKGATSLPHAHYQETIIAAAEFNGLRVISRKVL